MNVLVRDMPESTHAAWKRRAKENGRSLSAEILAALDSYAQPAERTGIGTALQQWKEQHWPGMEDFEFEVIRDQSPPRAGDFSGPEFDT